jgi:hypothetical protein
LAQQLALFKELAVRIDEDEKALEGLLQESPALDYVRSLPGMGPILAAVVVSEIDGIERFPSAQKLCGYAGLCPSTHSSGGKTFQGKLLRHCNKWLRWAFVEAAWVAIGCSAYFGDFYKRKRALGKKPSLAILATARLMARITWQLLTQRRAYTSLVRPNTSEASLPSGLPAREAWPRKCRNRSKIRLISLEEDFPQPLQNNAGRSRSRRL